VETRAEAGSGLQTNLPHDGVVCVFRKQIS
jgi:hypothetical protein